MSGQLSKDEMFTAIVDQRLRLVGELDGLSAVEWNTASLCVGWRVREVVGHLISILEIPLGTFLLGVAKARNFDRFSDQVARQIGEREPGELAATYRKLASTRFAPPVVGPIAPLVDVMVHTGDILQPLGRPVEFDPAAARTALDYVCGGKARGFVPSKRTKELRFQATDVDWSVGSGPTVSGPASALLLAATDRRQALAELSGDGVEILSRRLG